VCASHCSSEGRTLVLTELQAVWARDPVCVLFRREKFLHTSGNRTLIAWLSNPLPSYCANYTGPVHICVCS